MIASDQASARAYAAALAAVSGQAPTLVLSDEPGSSARIEAFARSTDRWLVAVRMVSEGVDIPRLSVGVYATSTSTPLFFAQAVGRFVRGRRRGETASIFLPSIPSLLEHAAALEAERDHVLGRRDDGENLWSAEDALVAEARRAARDGVEDDQLAFEALESEATFDRVLFDGGEFGTHAAAGSAEEEEFLGIPGLLEPHQVVTVLRARQAEQVAARGRRRVTGRGASAHHGRGRPGPAQGAERAGRGLAPPHRTPARDHPRRARARVRRTARRPRRCRDPAAQGGHDPDVGGRPRLRRR